MWQIVAMDALSEPRDTRPDGRGDRTDVLPPLAATKLKPPWTRAGLVARPRLVERLRDATTPIVTLVAPGGYGKTTLLAQWLSAHPGRSAWVSLDKNDNDPGLLLHYLLAALDRIAPVEHGVQRSLLAAASNDPPRALRGLGLVVAATPPPFVLVLDHVDAVENHSCGDLIAQVAMQLPAGARCVLASRTEPPLPIARLVAEGRVTQLGPAELAMDLDEAGKLLAAARVDVDQDTLQALHARTEGWPVGLYLAGATHAAGRDGGRSAVPNDDRLLVEYLRSEILPSFSPAERDFLTRTSVLDHLSGPLCDAVLGTTGSQDVLESLAGSNPLVVPIAGQRQWYRCHRLLRELLSTELERSDPGSITGLHDRAASWFETTGEIPLAIDHAQAAGNVRLAARLFAPVAVDLRGRGRAETVERWLDWFHERGATAQDPCIAVLGAFVEALAGRRVTAELFADMAAATPAEGTAPDGSTIESWLAVTEALLCRRGVAQMRADAEASLAGLGVHSSFRSAAAVLAGLAAILEDDADAADRLLTDGSELALRRGHAPNAALALAERAALAIDRGDWIRAGELSDGAVTVFERGGFDAHPQAVAVYAVAARISIRRGDPQRARSQAVLASRSRPLCTAAIPATAQLLLLLAHAYLALGDAAGARTVVRQMRELLRATPDLGIIADRLRAIQETLDTIGVGTLGASSLTAAELRLLPLLATHLSYQDVGERLFVSRNTIKSEAASLFRKLGASSRSEAVAIAERVGLLEPTIQP